ncbi:FecR family protein [Flavivirga abyssicola]|uniref:FecR family protein n=1 Tax=Flavivirga abyssicola TaxID=3063533 RepID=UPI0026DEDE9B|nr:FecR family protein [Flavivirga sp. MEBiC07777]WVK13812.1 FecR family protein [Flavivirga sp. MEBiC07777]
MEKTKIELIIVKFLNKEASHEELITLDLWLRNEKNIETFNRFAKTEYLIALSMDDFDLEKAKLNVKKKLKKNLRIQRIKQFSKYAVVAIMAVLLTIPFLNKNTDPVLTNSPKLSEETIRAGSNKAILTINGGDEIILEKNKSYESEYIKSDGNQLIYHQKDDVNETAYNYLTIPRGGQYTVQLSDGTKVWLNSDSKLKYPVNFIKGNPRTVELVYGEAYFEVTSSSKNDGSKFIVHSKLQDIEVLGTKFNIKAYDDEDSTFTTLIEGSVSINNKINTKLLSPNYQSIVNNNSPEISIVEANVSEAIAWKNGIFSFKKLPLKDIMKTLSRWYDTEAIFTNPEIETIEFTGVLGKDQKIEDILSIITNSNNIAYDIKNNIIIFK